MIGFGKVCLSGGESYVLKFVESIYLSLSYDFCIVLPNEPGVGRNTRPISNFLGSGNLFPYTTELTY